MNGAGLRACLLSSLALSPLPAQETSGPHGEPDSLLPRTSGLFVPAVTAECEAYPGLAEPTVAIQELPEPVYVHTLSKSEISSIENEASGQVREAVGLTLVLAGVVETQTAEYQAQSGGSCVVVEGVRVVPMKEVTVYLPRDYRIGSCNYRAVKRHEDKHVAIARRLVTEYQPRLVRAVSDLRLQSRGFAARGGDESASAGRLLSDVRSAVQGVIDELQAAMRDANRLLDLADTRRTLRECPSW